MDVIIVLTALAAFWVYPAVCFQCIAKKAGIGYGWLAWIPIANLYLICRLAQMPVWWMALCLIPYLGAIFLLVLLCQIPKRLGITGPQRFLIIVPAVNFFYLGWLAFRAEASSGTATNSQEGILKTVGIVAVCFLVFAGLVGAVRLQAGGKAREKAISYECAHNLRAIQNAKDMWAIEFNAKNGAVMPSNIMGQYLKEVPVCKAGGVYSYNPVGVEPTCSVHTKPAEGQP